MKTAAKSEYTRLSDKELCERVASGSKREAEAGFTALYDRYANRIHAYCARIVNDSAAAEDLFQETFVRFHDAVKQGNVMSNVSGLLFTIAKNLCLNHNRREKRWVSEEIYENTLVTREDAYEKKELIELVQRALDLLDDDFREAFVLREYNHLSYAEVAETLGTTVATAKIRVFRAKQKIRKILDPYLKDLLAVK